MDGDRELDLPERLAHIADYEPKDRCVRCGDLSEVPRARAEDGTMTREGPFCLRCWRRLEYVNNPERRSQLRAGRRKYEALLRGATPPGETIRLRDIAERDAWICQLCGDPVDPTIQDHGPDSPSLDHIVPISRGGSHTYDNVQLAHLSCNVRKGNRLPGEPGPKYGSEDRGRYLLLA